MRGKSRPRGAVVVAPVLPLDVLMVVSTLTDADALGALVTRWCFTDQRGRWMARVPLLARCNHRPSSPAPDSRLRRCPLADLRAQLGKWAGEDGVRCCDASFALVDRAAAKMVHRTTSAVLGREDGCLAAFAAGAECGRPRIYQLPTAHYAMVRALMRREVEQFPDAFVGSNDSAEFAVERTRRKDMELAAATHVLCPSEFVRRSVLAARVDPHRIVTIPFGADTHWPAPPEQSREALFLYVGNITPRKGVHRLLRVWKLLGAYRTCRLRLVGKMQLPAPFVREYQSVFEHRDRVPRDRLSAEYSQAQAFVFNPMADGFGHVFAEAMICATPALSSRNSGAPDLISDGVEGKLFDYGDDEQLAAALEWALSYPGKLREMGRAARARALTWGWREFGLRFMQWFASVVHN